ncbi:hypothetical protein HMPREF9946_04614 [Acetobacteraceae bacterium AT-5844]|nr:hypothetical protein HMPREF9946_04614 [Acetobacteraceae bacterium AT-5844]
MAGPRPRRIDEPWPGPLPGHPRLKKKGRFPGRGGPFCMPARQAL